MKEVGFCWRINLGKSFAEIPVNRIERNSNQSRKSFDRTSLDSLSESIRKYGVLNPIVVIGPYAREGKEIYHLVDGERRLRASILAGIDIVPAHIIPANGIEEKSKLLLSLIANVQREDLSPIDEAIAYSKLNAQGFSHQEIANIAGKGRTVIENRLFLLKFEPEIQDLYAKHKLNLDMRVYYALKKLPSSVRIKAANKLAEMGATQHDAEVICKKLLRREDIVNVKPRLEKLLDETQSDPKNALHTSLTNLIKNSELPDSWIFLLDVGEKTCKACNLYASSSASMCRDCPAVDMARYIVKEIPQGSEQ